MLALHGAAEVRGWSGLVLEDEVRTIEQAAFWKVGHGHSFAVCPADRVEHDAICSGPNRSRDTHREELRGPFHERSEKRDAAGVDVDRESQLHRLAHAA